MSDTVTVPRWALECLINQPMWLSISDEMEAAALVLQHALKPKGNGPMSDYLFNNHDGHRGGTFISGVTYADLYDFIYHIAEPYTFDRDALCQQVCVEVEKAQGIFPNVDIGEAPPFNSAELMICLEHLERVRTGTVDTWVTTKAGYFELSVLSNALFTDRLVVQEKQQ